MMTTPDIKQMRIRCQKASMFPSQACDIGTLSSKSFANPEESGTCLERASRPSVLTKSISSGNKILSSPMIIPENQKQKYECKNSNSKEALAKSPTNQDLIEESHYVKQSLQYKQAIVLKEEQSSVEPESSEEEEEYLNLTKFELIRPNLDHFIARNLQDIGLCKPKTKKQMNKMEVARNKYSRWVGSKCSSPNIAKAQSKGRYRVDNLKSNNKSLMTNPPSPKIPKSQKKWTNQITESESWNGSDSKGTDTASLLSSLIVMANKKSRREKKLEQVEIRGKVKDFMKDNGLDKLDHLSKNELIIKMIKQLAFDNLVKKEEESDSNKSVHRSDSALRNHIEDFERQLLRIQTNPRGLFRRKVNKSKIKRFL